jgi:hypothetical protein
MSPQRIQLRRTPGWRKPPGVVVVARPSKWGNPYSVGRCSQIHEPGQHWHVYESGEQLPIREGLTRTEATDWAIYLYEKAIEGDEWRDMIRAELAGRDLACWCPLADANGRPVPCHADVLLRIAAGEQP